MLNLQAFLQDIYLWEPDARTGTVQVQTANEPPADAATGSDERSPFCVDEDWLVAYRNTAEAERKFLGAAERTVRSLAALQACGFGFPRGWYRRILQSSTPVKESCGKNGQRTYESPGFQAAHD